MAQATDNKVLFVIGAGPRIGTDVSKAFANIGYKVALGRRQPPNYASQIPGAIYVRVDVTDDESIKKAFDEVRSKLGEPTVVVYNAGALAFADFSDPFTLSPGDFQNNISANVGGGYTSIYESIISFKKNNDPSVPKAFIATGNVLPFKPWPSAPGLGAGKAALVHLIDIGASAYQDKGYKFYFASQITEEGGPVPYAEVDGPAHGTKYIELVNGPLVPWDVRFVA